MAASTTWAPLPWGITAVLPSQAAHHKCHITWSSSRSFFALKWKALLVTNCPQHDLECLQTLSPLWAQPKWEMTPGLPTVVFTRQGYSSLQERAPLHWPEDPAPLWMYKNYCAVQYSEFTEKDSASNCHVGNMSSSSLLFKWEPLRHQAV